MESLTGPVPGHWSIAVLGDVCDVDAGSSQVSRLARSDPEGLFHVVTAKHIIGHTLETGGGEPAAGAVPPGLERYRLRPGDVVFTRIGRLGRAALAGIDQENWLLGSGCLRLRPRPGLDPRYLLHYLGHPAVADWLSRFATGSVIPTHSLRSLRALPVVLPPEDEQDTIVNTLAVLDDKIAIYQEIVQTTGELRDRMLRLLLGGARPRTDDDSSGGSRPA